MPIIKIEMSKFIEEINEMTKKSDTTYMDALLTYSEKNNIELEAIADLVKRAQVLKSNLYEEAEELNMVEKTSKLPTQ